MGDSLNPNNSTVISAFQSTLLRQALFVLAIAALVAIAWNVLRTLEIRAASRPGARPVAVAEPPLPEPAARRLLRLAFGLIWLFDGLLQAQSSMPLGMPTGVLQPAASSSPGWVQHLVNVGVTIWNNHPVPAAVSVVWIQVGIGLWLLVCRRGLWSRAGGLVSAGWGLVVWSFGESFGGIFGTGSTWLFGTPGAVVFYVAAGLLIALPRRAWTTPRLGRWVLAAMGAFFLGMALLQAWPGRGFWQGQTHPATSGQLTQMVQSMSQTPQPGIFGSLLSDFGGFAAAHGWGVNLFVVVALAAIGAAFVSGRRRLVFPAVVAGVVLCLADWVFVQDFGFLGGVGTDPNSMIPMALVFVSGYVAMVRVPAAATEPAEARPREAPESAPERGWLGRLAGSPGYALQALLAVGAAAIILLGAVPMALASTNPVADPILNQAIVGTPGVTNIPAAPFRLVDQHGDVVSLAALRGKAVALTFIDPVCTTDCPLIAQEFREADQMLGSEASKAKFIAVVANPLYNSVADTRAFDRQEGLTHIANWLYLTGTRTQLATTWSRYGIEAQVSPAGSMVAHTEEAFVISPDGRLRYELDADPGQGTQAMRSSFAGVVASEVRGVLGT